MRLRFKEGAIVEIIMWGKSKEDNTFIGKVLDVKEDEVVMMPQARIIKGENEVAVWMPTETKKAMLSVDIGDAIHVNRQLIKCWRYININELTEEIRFVNNKNKESGKSIEDYKLNSFDSLGYCKGKGEDFSCVLEGYTNGGITISINDI